MPFRFRMACAGGAWILSVAVILLCLGRSAYGQEADGGIEGRLLNDGKGVADATVALASVSPNEITKTSFTGPEGEFSFFHLPPGEYTITFTLGPNGSPDHKISVSSGSVVPYDETVTWETGFTDSQVVRGVSRYPEALVKAPAAATVIGDAAIELKAADGQLAKLLEFTPGAQITQGGLWDFNIGTRGFNRALSRRVAVFLDGRDLSLPFFGYQGWAAFSFPLDDLASIEFMRGPSAALYGANSAGGIINLTSKEPRLSEGGMIRVAAGQQDTLNVDGRWAGALGRGWYARAVGGIRHSSGFAVPRVNAPEYSHFCDVGAFADCLSREVVSFDGEGAQIVLGGLRFDRVFADGLLLTAEGGYAQGGFGVFQAAGQRAKSVGTDGRRPWGRFSIGNASSNATVAYDGYDEPSGFQGLSTGSIFNSHAHRVQMEGLTSRRFRHDTVSVKWGGEAVVEKMTSFNSDLGTQTFLLRPVTSDKVAAFGQATWDLNTHVQAMLAVRGDWSTLYDFQPSPRVSVVYSIAPEHNVRLTYSRGFQAPNLLEYFLDASVAAPVDLTALNAFCTPFRVDCHFGSTPVLALGNEDLRVERVRTLELGYAGALAHKTLMTLDYYRSHSANLVTSLLPQIGTSLGRLNSRFGEWNGPAGLPDEVVDQIRTLVPLLSTQADGSNILAAASYTNFPNVDTQGLDFGVSHEFPGGWRSAGTYSWFDFRIPPDALAAEGLLLPNSPPHTLSAGLTYGRPKLAAGIDARWVRGFRWADGFFLGNVPSYTTVDASATYRMAANVTLGLNVTNLLNDRHWETFGGAVLTRRMLLSLQYDWRVSPARRG